ncbi:hypothetical protein L1987_47884 [Smallanthus sonchifolius]|uniref:Uncharacterized protein n=1 Tax=Smallanthus sonchifolius TaxID=185202 RepID=A0ACB9FQ95_9ASTR|nr:hypothetical protein L1987_47884 [Smallanthus sonchifolius]
MLCPKFHNRLSDIEISALLSGTELAEQNKSKMASSIVVSVPLEPGKYKALPFSHFISLPLALPPSLVDKLINFQNSILGMNDATELGIDASIFTKPQTLHLTVLMLKLWDEERLDAAVRIFKGIEAEVMDALGGQSVSIKLKGLACFNDSFDKVHILYAPVEVVGGDGRLLRACNIITDAFINSGLVLVENTRHTLKLHATVMNTIYRNRAYPFDAGRIVEKYGSEAWGECSISEIHLSERFVYDENGYYHRCASFPLNPRNMQVD